MWDRRPRFASSNWDSEPSARSPGRRSRALEGAFGQSGHDLWELANGKDDRPVEPEQCAKSIGAEHTFSEDTDDRSLLRKTILELADRVGHRLRHEEVLAGGVTLKFRDHRFHTVTRAAILAPPTDVGDDVFRAAWELLAKVEWKGNRVRLLGVTATRLQSAAETPAGQLSLFSPATDSRRELARTVDTIQERYGREAITRASLLTGKRKPRTQSSGLGTRSREPRENTGTVGNTGRRKT